VGSRDKAPVGGLAMKFPEADDIFLKGKVSTKNALIIPYLIAKL